MKLYSIGLFHKQREGVQKLSDAYNLQDFGFFQRTSVKDFMAFTYRLIVERAALPSRNSIKEQGYWIHCYVRQDGLTGACVSDADYEARVAFSLLSKILEDFSRTVPNWAHLSKPAEYAKLPEFLSNWQNPAQADSISRVQNEVEETKVVLHSTIQSVLERGEKLDDLIRASENLSEQSKLFYTQARRMNKCCNWV